MTTRKRRTLEERIADQRVKLQELEAKQNLEKVEQAIDQGDIEEEDKAEFKRLKKELASVKKVIKAAERHQRPQILSLMNIFRNEITGAMTGLVNTQDE